MHCNMHSMWGWPMHSMQGALLTHCKQRKCRHPVCRSRWQWSQVPSCCKLFWWAKNKNVPHTDNALKYHHAENKFAEPKIKCLSRWQCSLVPSGTTYVFFNLGKLAWYSDPASFVWYICEKGQQRSEHIVPTKTSDVYICTFILVCNRKCNDMFVGGKNYKDLGTLG